MNLRGQPAGVNERGYAMAALLVALSIMSIVAAAAMPAWRQMARREKEAELIFRGEQYARAIALFQRRAGPGVNPSNLDLLIQQRFLRKKYKDPITGDDFELIGPGSALSIPTAPTAGGSAVPGFGAARGAAPAQPGRGTGAAPAGRGGAGQGAASGGAGGRGSQPQFGSTFGAPGRGGAPAGIMGVASKSKEKSIRIYNGRNYYNEWQFVFIPQQQPGVGPGGRGAPGVVGPGGRGQRGGPQRGMPQQPGFPGRGGFGAPPTQPPQQPQRGRGNPF
jgi:type II secretory pathway pseudopilin PulG